MPFIHGKNVLLEYGTGDPMEWTPFVCAKSCDITITQEFLKKTDTVNGKFNSVIPTGISGVMNVSGLIKFDGNTFDPVNMILNQTELRARFIIIDGIDEKYLTAIGFMASANMSGGVYALAEQSLTIQLSGIIETN